MPAGAFGCNYDTTGNNSKDFCDEKFTCSVNNTVHLESKWNDFDNNCSYPISITLRFLEMIHIYIFVGTKGDCVQRRTNACKYRLLSNGIFITILIFHWNTIALCNSNSYLYPLGRQHITHFHISTSFPTASSSLWSMAVRDNIEMEILDSQFLHSVFICFAMTMQCSCKGKIDSIKWIMVIFH